MRSDESTLMSCSHPSMFSTNTPIPHQLRPATHLHDIHVLSRSRRHQSLIHLPPMREDRSCEHAQYLPVINSQLTENAKALTKSQDSNIPPPTPTPTPPRQLTKHQRHPPPLNPFLAPTIPHFLPPYPLSQTARRILPAARLCCPRNRTAHCAGRSGEGADLLACGQHGGGDRWARGSCGNVGEGVGKVSGGKCGRGEG